MHCDQEFLTFAVVDVYRRLPTGTFDAYTRCREYLDAGIPLIRPGTTVEIDSFQRPRDSLMKKGVALQFGHG